jgi:hypothetical protein
MIDLADRTRRNSVTKQPVTSHPLFPVLVVLWFGALFGLASLAIRPALIERIVSAASIDHVIPMAAPPLGTTTRILIALAMTVLGCLIGMIVARRVAKPAAQSASVRRRRPAPADSALPVALVGGERQEETDEDTVKEDEDEEAPVVRRRRQLAILPDETEAFDDHAPVPGATQILSVAELELESFDQVDEVWVRSSDSYDFAADGRTRNASTETFDHQAFDDPAPQPENRLETFAQAPHEIAADDLAAHEAAAEPTAADDSDEGAVLPRSNRLFETYVRRVNAGVGSNDAHAVAAPGFVSLPTMDEQDFAAPPPVAPEADTVADAGPEPAYANAAERIASAPLDTLSHVELLERLAITIARRRAEWAQAAERQAVAEPKTEAQAETSAPVVEKIEELDEPETTRFSPSARFAPPAATPWQIPAALRPHWIEDEYAQDDALPAYIPPRHIAMKPAVAPLASTEDEEDILAEGYSSLLGVTKPAARQEFVRGDEPDAAESAPPVFAFPGLQDQAKDQAQTAPASPRAFDAPRPEEPTSDQTEQALRAALATLRRMSGAA